MSNPEPLIPAVAIDGPAGSGKSSVARAVARARNFLYVDTGAMYRALALKAMRDGENLEDETAMARVAAAAAIRFNTDGTEIILDGENVSQEIRSPEVTANVKFMARVPDVRKHLILLQRALCRQRPVVMEGRDITTVVLPQAKWKFFLTASPEVRANRRFAEMRAAGRDVQLQQILADINHRDDLDYHVGPMKDARDRALANAGIVHLDTSGLTPDQVVQQILAHME